VSSAWPEAPNEHPLGDGRFASAVEQPSSLDALRDAVSRRVSEGLAIYPQGGRSSLDFGGTPSRPGALVDLSFLNRVVDYPAADMTITIEAGMTLAALQQTLATEGQRLPLDAPQANRATLGGIYATNFSGPRRFGAGRPRDLIIGVRFVNGEGNVIKGGGRVVKNVAGYDLPKLLTGSMGTLGVIAEMTLKVRPKPESSAIVWVGSDSADAIAATLDRLNTSVTRPVALELLNRPSAVAIGGHLGFPESRWVLAVGIEDNAASVAWQITAIKNELVGHSVITVEGGDAQQLWAAMSEFPASADGTFGFIANVRPSFVSPFLDLLDPARWSAQAHAGSGIVRAFSRNGLTSEDLAPEIPRLRSRAVADGGNLILSRCPAADKARHRVWGEPRPDVFLAKKVKQALDPSGVMNPGRFGFD
jgi:glycolate oxidase FAD binding subunit